jgi:PAS domain S-box-containing protein
VNGEVDFVNRAIVEYTGRTLDELKQWGTTDIVHPEDLPQVAEVFTRSVASSSPYEINERLRRSDGVYRWFHSKAFPLRGPDGHIVRWCALLNDIDEQKRVEDALRESERESRLIVNTIPALVATLTSSGDLDVVNNRMLDYFGVPPDEVRRWATNNIIHRDDRPRVVQIFRQVMASGKPHEYEVRLRRFDGVYRWFQLRGHPLRDVSGGISRWYVLLFDIEGLKRAEDEVRGSERNLQLIIDTIPALAWSARADGSVEFFNRALSRFHRVLG